MSAARAALFVLLLLSCGHAGAAALRVGQDLPFRWYEDRTARLGLDGFLALRDADLAEGRHPVSMGYTRSALWVELHLPAVLFEAGERWMQLGPNFLDHLTLYYRPAGTQAAWVRRQAGDLEPGPVGDLDYRFSVFKLPPPPAAAQGYDVVLRIQSTSAVLLQAALWDPGEFLGEAAGSTAFWSAYFGLAAISSGVALILAVVLRRRLLWSVCAFSFTYLLAACVQGYVDWPSGRTQLHLQHYLTSVLSLLSFAGVLWMSSEALGLRQHLPRVYRLVMSAIVLNLLLQASIPLDFYGLAMEMHGAVFAVIAVVFAGGALLLWRREGLGIVTLMLGLLPLLYVLSAILALLSLYGLIPYYERIYAVWQYLVMINMLGVLGLAVYRIRHENLQIQEKQQLARELRIEREASFNQRQFIGMVSHEFRTPLSIISGSLANLRLQPISEEQRARRYEKIRRATERLVQLTDNCLADARLSAERLYVDRQPTELLELARTAATVVDISDQHRLQLTVEQRPADPQQAIHLAVDGGLLRIALSNLLDNAVKYSEQGTIGIDVSRRGGVHVIAISDEGAGIPESETSRIFERYRRVETPGRNSLGTGLGLYVARQVALAHGGDLRLAANSPQGCRFELTLPTTEQTTTAP